jgi:hypothetical protein
MPFKFYFLETSFYHITYRRFLSPRWRFRGLAETCNRSIWSKSILLCLIEQSIREKPTSPLLCPLSLYELNLATVSERMTVRDRWCFTRVMQNRKCGIKCQLLRCTQYCFQPEGGTAGHVLKTFEGHVLRWGEIQWGLLKCRQTAPFHYFSVSGGIRASRVIPQKEQGLEVETISGSDPNRLNFRRKPPAPTNTSAMW